MKELKGFKLALKENRDFCIEMMPELTNPEATALSVKATLQAVGGERYRIGQAGSSTQEIFGVSYKEFLEECKRRKELVESSPAMDSARRKLRK